MSQISFADKTSIKVFIASSSEVKAERDKCILILFLLNKCYPHLHLEPIMWEYDLAKRSYPDFENLQDAINEKLQLCNLATFIFYTKIGIYTKEEFDLTMKQKLVSFVFFKSVTSKEILSGNSYSELFRFRETMENKISPIDYLNLAEFEYEFYKNFNLHLAQTYFSESHLMMTIHELQETLKSQEKMLRDLEEQLGTQIENNKLKTKALAEITNRNFVNAEECLKQSAKEHIEGAAATFFELAILKELQFLYQEAYSYYDLAAKIEPTNVEYLVSAGSIASTFLDQQDEAICHFKKALKFGMQCDDNDIIIRSLSNLATACDRKGNYSEAILYSHKAIEMIEQNKIIDSQQTPAYYALIGHLHSRFEEFDKAIDYLIVGLEKAKNFFLEAPENMALIHNNLGNAYVGTKEYDKAVQNYIAAINITTRLKGMKNIDVATQNANLARAYMDWGYMDYALECLKIALEISTQIYKKENKHTSFIYYLIGCVYNKKGQYDIAIEYLEKSLKVTKEIMGNKHPDVAHGYLELAIAWQGKGSHREMELHYLEQALLIYKVVDNEQNTVIPLQEEIDKLKQELRSNNS